jgi:xylan 1,4-beta-xylosidase
MTTLYNPLVPGFNPDPSATVVDGVYYLVTSTFEYMPGIPVYSSTDLETWRQIGNVITRPEQGGLEHAPTNGGVWAPTIRHRDGRFYVIVTIAMGRGCMLYSATDPAGPWDDGVLIEGIEGIDPDLNWDDEGVAIVTYSGLDTKTFGEHKGIRQVDVDLATGELLSEKRGLWSGSGFMFPEAPHLYRHGDHWYLMIAEGGTERGHGVSIARGRDPRGPFEPGPANPIVTARSTELPVQNTGHGDLIETPEGTMMVLLGVRPRGMTRAFSALGRETFLTRVHWDADGWPTVEPVQLNPRPGGIRQTWGFASPLDPSWLAVRRAPEDVVDLESAPGKLTLVGAGNDLTAEHPVFLGRRQPNQTATVSVLVDARGGRGGLAVRYDEKHVYSLTLVDDGRIATVTAEARVPGIVQSWSAELPSGPVELVLDTHRPPQDDLSSMTAADLVGFIARSGGQEVRLAEVDGRYLSAETAASFTGRVTGVFAVEGTVVFSPLQYEGSDD